MAEVISSIFQKTLTGLDLAMFCFPESQPPGPYNCTLVSLQLLRLLTPVESTTLIPKYPRGVLRKDAELHVSNLAEIPVTFKELSILDASALDNYIFPGFACVMVISTTEQDINHTVIYWKTPTGVMLLIDPQTGKIYSKEQIPGYETIRKWDVFFARHRLSRLEVLQYTDKTLTKQEHSIVSQLTDNKIANNSIITFFKRGTFVRSGVYPSSLIFLPSEVEMTGGKQSKRTRKHSSRSAKLTK